MTEKTDSTSLPDDETPWATLDAIYRALALGYCAIGFLGWPIALFSSGMWGGNREVGVWILLSSIVQPWLNWGLVRISYRTARDRPATRPILFGIACLVAGSAALALFISPEVAALTVYWMPGIITLLAGGF